MEKDGAVWFRDTLFGAEKDEVLIRATANLPIMLRPYTTEQVPEKEVRQGDKCPGGRPLWA